MREVTLVDGKILLDGVDTGYVWSGDAQGHLRDEMAYTIIADMETEFTMSAQEKMYLFGLLFEVAV